MDKSNFPLIMFERVVNEILKYRINPNKLEVSDVYKTLFDTSSHTLTVYGIPVSFTDLDRKIARVYFNDPMLNTFMNTDYKFGHFVEIPFLDNEEKELEKLLEGATENTHKRKELRELLNAIEGLDLCTTRDNCE